MLRTDLKIFKSQRMTQNANGGGQRTANEVANGQLNDVFGNISAIDHAQSAVDIVKVYPGVSTADTQLLQDAHVLINEPPTDPLVDVIMIESAAINDASTKSGIVQAIESGVTAGLLLRSGLSAMLAGQNTIAAQDLLGVTNSNEQPNVILMVGQVIAISVEYTGAPNIEFPRFTHYCKVTSRTADNIVFGLNTNSQGNVSFEPPLPFNTPSRNTNINGQTSVTRLRATNTNQNVVYHGVSRLTAAANEASVLSVQKTQGSLLPRLTSIVERADNRPFVTDVGLIRKKAVFAAGGRVYNLPIADIATLGGTNIQNTITVSYVSQFGGAGNITVPLNNYNDGILSFTLPGDPLANSELIIFYFSSERYESYASNQSWPANRVLIANTVFGTVFRNIGLGSRVSIFTNPTAAQNQFFANGTSGRELAAEVNIFTGEWTYYNGYSDVAYLATLANTQVASDTVTTTDFILAYEQVQINSLYITAELSSGGLISASADSAGIITGVGVTGSVNNATVSLVFTSPVLAGSITYTVNEIVLLTPPASTFGINQLRIANSGVVPLFREFGVISITNNAYSTVGDLPENTVLSQRPAAFIDIVDSTGASLWHPLDAHYSYNKTTGDVTIINTSGFTGPYEITDTIGELALVSAVNNNQLALTAPLKGNYPAGSVVSSVQVLGNLQAVANVLFDMTTWQNVWNDEITGTPASANFNELNYPIEVENRSAINERWVIVFTSSTAFVCIGEGLGQIASGDTLNDFAPINPNTLQPYFVIRKQGWGGGWNAGECVRFNTVAAAKPLVLLRAVSAGHSQIEQDSIRLHFRGNAD